MAKCCRAALRVSRQIAPSPSVAFLPRSTLSNIMCLPSCACCREALSASLTLPSARGLALGEEPHTWRIGKFSAILPTCLLFCVSFLPIFPFCLVKVLFLFMNIFLNLLTVFKLDFLKSEAF